MSKRIWSVRGPSTRSLWLGQAGNISVVSAFAMLALVICAGAALDYGRMGTARTELAAAVDAAALQIGSSALTKKEDMAALAGEVLKRNYSEADYGPIDSLDVRISGDVITLAVRATYRTSLMGIAGIPSMSVPVEAEVTRSGTSLEFALVLDTTGSMKGSRIDALKSAANDFIDTVVWDNQKLLYSKVAIIPYSMGVNVGSLADKVRGVPATGTCSAPGCQRYKFLNQFKSSKTFDLSTCVSERIGAEAYTDASPLVAPVGWNYASPNNPCIPYEFIPLTSDKAKLKAVIGGLDGSGSTASQVGVAWGWYVLSRDFGIWSGENQPAESSNAKVKKYALLMTDGEFNSSYCSGVIARSSTAGSGVDGDKINCDAPNGSPLYQVAKLCEAMKKKGITIYTIGFDIENLDIVKQTLSNCASGSKNAFLAATNEALKAVFLEIGRKVSGLRLSR